MTLKHTAQLRFTTFLAPLALVLLGACGSEVADENAVSEPRSANLAALLEGDEDLAIAAETLKQAGLAELLDGAAPYTILAPADGAFTALGDEFEGESSQAAKVALLREHILPGYLTRADIAAAIANDDDGKVVMQSMGSDALVFSGSGDAITVQSADGANTALLGEESLGANGVIIRVPSLLKSTAAAPQ